MSGRSSQAKGRRAEIELADILREHGYPDARPGEALNYGTQPDVVGVPGVHLEVKRRERLEVSRWYQQAVTDAERMKDGVPVVVYRQNRKPWMAVLSLEDLLSLMERKNTDFL